MVDIHSKKDIDKISYEILKNSKSFDVFPTPIDKIADYSELVVRKDVDISQVHESYIQKAGNALKSALSKVRGLFDHKQKTIYLDLSQMPTKRNFVQLHEIGHGVLYWQTDVYKYMDDDDHSLNDEYSEEFEAEANYFASVTLFQHDRFENEVKKYGLGVEASTVICKHFGASIHATLRRYVDTSKKRCALVVLENITAKGQVPKCNIKSINQSARYTEDFGELTLPHELGFTWDFVKDYYFKRKFKTDGNIEIVTENGLVDFHYHFFYNGYNGFVFLFPNGEKKSATTKIIITNHSL